MLQQTRVETVIPYFDRFLKLFPSLPALARAPLSRILKVWAGLGYYARARNLHAAARTICQDLGGKIPRTKEDLLRLPGFGPYTAGAVASIAFHQPVVALDGNVKRILERLFPKGNHHSGTASPKDLEKSLAEWIPAARASDFNQALMDLGAAICLPARPRCGACPVRRFCATQGERKEKKPAGKKFREETWAVALVQKDGKFLLHRNPDKGLLAGLWQFPKIVGEKRPGPPEEWEDPGKSLQQSIRKDFGLKIRVERPLAEEDYFFTHIHARMKPYLCSVRKSPPPPPLPKDARWVSPSSLGRFAISTAMRRMAKRIS